MAESYFNEPDQVLANSINMSKNVLKQLLYLPIPTFRVIYCPFIIQMK